MMHEKCLSRKIAVAFALCESSEKSRSNAKAAKTQWLKFLKIKQNQNQKCPTLENISWEFRV